MGWSSNVGLDVMPCRGVVLSLCSIGAGLAEHVHVSDFENRKWRSQLEALLHDSFGGVANVWRKESSTCCAEEEETEDEREGGQC